MTRTCAITVKPYSKITEMKPQKVDRFFVQGWKTIFGKTLFCVVGQLGETGICWTISPQFEDFDAAWQEKLRFDEMRRVAAREQKEGKLNEMGLEGI